MMTTDRTAIRRGLAVGRRAHRPPAGARKVAHHLILTPLTATIAAGAAVGLALLLAERNRRPPGAPGRAGPGARRFELLAGEDPVRGLGRIAVGQLEEAIELLEDIGDGDSPGRTVHDTRKALKRARTVLRLLREELGEEAFARENGELRRAGLHLAGAREAEAMIAMLDSLLARHPRRLAGGGLARELRVRLIGERERALAELSGDSRLRREVVYGLREERARLEAWEPGPGGGTAVLRRGLHHSYRDGRRRMRQLGEHGGGSVRQRHRWRRRVKDLRYGAEILGLAGLARRADELAELLGEEHDLALLAGRVRAGTPKGSRGRRRLLKVIARRRRKLRRRALARGARLYRRRPRAFAKWALSRR